MKKAIKRTCQKVKKEEKEATPMLVFIDRGVYNSLFNFTICCLKSN